MKENSVRKPHDFHSLNDLSSDRQDDDWYYHQQMVREGLSFEIVTFDLCCENFLIDSFKEAYWSIFQRHDSLRTIFPVVQGTVMQAILKFEPTLFPIPIYDAQSLVATTLEKLIHDHRKKIELEFTDLGKDPLAKGILLQTGRETFLFLFVCHHILCDEHGLMIFRSELFHKYNLIIGRTTEPLPEKKLQLMDYHKLRNEKTQGEYGTRSNRYWTDKLEKHLTKADYSVLYRNISEDFPSLAEIQFAKKNMSQAGWYSFYSSTRNKEGLTRLSQSLNISVPIILMGCFFFCIYICFRLTKVLINTTVNGRDVSNVPDPIIGNLACNVFIKGIVNEFVPFRQVATQIYLDFLQSARFPISNFGPFHKFKIRENADFYINFQTFGVREYLRTDRENTHFPDKAFYALSLIIGEYSDGFSLKWCYQTGIYNASIIEHISAVYQEVVIAVLRDQEVSPSILKATNGK